jgi:iron complex transport system ATP-binding protein
MRDHEVILDALKKTSMSSLAQKFISELSDGERQKAMIARILAQDTGIMVMDEPTAFLDVASKYEILHLMHQLSGSGTKTIIFSTHDLQMAISQADKIWLILENELIEGAPEDLMLAGEFDHLFDSSTVIFNSEDGTFSFRSETRGAVYLEGEGSKKYWTEKAINRGGFKVSKEKTLPFIILPTENNSLWKLVNETDIQEFRSLYELMGYLSGTKRASI